MRHNAGEQARHVRGRGGIAAQEPVRTEAPQIPRARDWHDRNLRHRVLVGIAQAPAEQVVDRSCIEAQQIEVHAQVTQVGYLESEQVPIPTALQGKLVVGDDIGPLLGLVEMAEKRAIVIADDQPSLAGRLGSGTCSLSRWPNLSDLGVEPSICWASMHERSTTCWPAPGRSRRGRGGGGSGRASLSPRGICGCLVPRRLLCGDASLGAGRGALARRRCAASDGDRDRPMGWTTIPGWRDRAGFSATKRTGKVGQR